MIGLFVYLSVHFFAGFSALVELRLRRSVERLEFLSPGFQTASVLTKASHF
jgi:hypothetical protein